MAEKLKVKNLGHSDRVGAQCYAYIYGKEILLVDCGVDVGAMTSLPVDEKGRQIMDLAVLPDVEWIIQNLDRIAGLVVTHGHYDHMVGIAHLPDEVLERITIYAAPFTASLIERQLNMEKRAVEPNCHIFNANKIDSFQIGNFKVKHFPVAHSIPQTSGLLIEIKGKRAVHLTDFKFNGLSHTPKMKLHPILRQIGRKRVDLLVMDVLEVRSDGYTQQENLVFESLLDLIRSIDLSKRVIFSSFASNVPRVREVALIARNSGRTFGIHGQSMEDGFFIAQDCRLMPKIKVTFYKEATLLAVTGCQGEYNAVLAKATRRKGEINIGPNDVVILSSRIIPGNEQGFNSQVKDLAKLGATVYVDSRAYDKSFARLKNVKPHDMLHVSGHGSLQDKIDAIKALSPAKVFPIHGPHEDNVAFEAMMTHSFPNLKMEDPLSKEVVC